MTGFSTESFTFLRGLEDNNNRDWFNENKAQFAKHLEKPFTDLLEALSNRLMDARRPLSGGKSTMFRMNRDLPDCERIQGYQHGSIEPRYRLPVQDSVCSGPQAA